MLLEGGVEILDCLAVVPVDVEGASFSLLIVGFRGGEDLDDEVDGLHGLVADGNEVRVGESGAIPWGRCCD